MPSVTRHQIGSSAARPRSVELFQASPDTAAQKGAILFVHGHQKGSRLGGQEAVDDGTLLHFCTRLSVTAASVSQPGYGSSEGPPDFCGPATQQAIHAALSFLRGQSSVDPNRIILYGHSRGAIASAMVASQDVALRALILVAGVYDLATAYRTAPPGIRWNIEQEAGVSSSAFAARSALYHVDTIRSETLLLHGRYDERAPFVQAEKLAEGLSGTGAAISFHAFDCGHNIPRELRRAAIRPLLRRIFGSATGDDSGNE